MNSNYKMTLAALVGAALGAAAVQGLHAQAKPPVYTVTEIDVSNVDAYMKEYVPVVQPMLKKGGGTLLAASLKVTAMLGTAPKRVAIIAGTALKLRKRITIRPSTRPLKPLVISTRHSAGTPSRGCRSSFSLFLCG